MRVLRVEHRLTHRGPFNFGDIPNEDRERHYETFEPWDFGGVNFPTPYNDGIYGFIRDVHVCGFESATQLLSWFDGKCLAALKSSGFEVVAFAVKRTDVLFGARQIAFDPTLARRVCTLSTADLRKETA